MVTEHGRTTDKLGHDHQLKNQKDAACEEPGYSSDSICSRCGDIESKGTVTDKLGHKWGNWNLLKNPTCVKKREDGGRAIALHSFKSGRK